VLDNTATDYVYVHIGDEPHINGHSSLVRNDGRARRTSGARAQAINIKGRAKEGLVVKGEISRAIPALQTQKGSHTRLVEGDVGE
jgi:hypothetical protein